MDAAIILLVIGLFGTVAVGLWKTLVKAGERGWAWIIPFYNVFVFLRVARLPAWYLILMLVPIVNLIPLALMYHGIAKNFGKGTGFAVGIWLLPWIFYPILGFGSATFQPKEPAV